jgi:hypothetical protein
MTTDCILNYKLKPFWTFRTIFEHDMFYPCSAKRRASDKDLPVNVKLTVKISSIGLVKKKRSLLKVRLFQTAFVVSSILPKNELDNSKRSFVRFLGELKTPKSPFEIN